MPLDIARRLAAALDVRSNTAIRQIDRALSDYARLVPQAGATPLEGEIGTDQVTSGTFADARIAESNVTQHEAALDITEIQITDLGNYGEVDQPETVSEAWTFANLFGLSGQLDVALTADQQDWNPTGLDAVSVLRVTPDSDWSIGGMVPTGPRLLAVYNVSSSLSVTLTHNDGSSAAANRFICPAATDVVIHGFGGALLVYASSRWRVISLAGNYPQKDVAAAITSPWDFQSRLGIGGQLEVTPSTNQDDYSPTGFADTSYLSINAGASIDITGFDASAGNRRLLMINQRSANTVTLKHEDALSAADNRMRLPGAADVALGQNAGVMLVYWLNRWRIVAKT